MEPQRIGENMSKNRATRKWATRAIVAATTLACLTAAGAVTTVSPASSAPATTETSSRSTPGPVRAPLILADQVDLKGYDVAIDAAGTSYIGWISTPIGQTNRAVHLCVLPLNATACKGGVQSTPSFGTSSAAGLQVLAPPGGPVRLVWFHDTPQSVDGPYNAKIATATVSAAGVLSPGASVGSAPSFGSLSTAEVGPDGVIWAVLARPSGTGLRVVAGLDREQTELALPFNFHKARLAFRGSTPILVIDKAGAIAEPLRVAHFSGTGWTPFTKVPKTWNLGGAFDVAAAGGGTHLVATVDNSSYYPQVAAWTGAGFGRFQLTGDKNSCAPRSHDLVTDRSGRLADVSIECT
ncbi:hypothetical protein, partial [Nocardioides sp.]|uniref:hypothetical protein n=1 Tax=Nocardioides sp. TaxID=35761 RepID=UPI00273685F2